MAGNVNELKFSPLGGTNPPAILRYGLAVLSVIAGALAHTRDELQRNNEGLREREELLRVLTENANDLIRLHTMEGRSVYASPSVERLFGRPPTSLFEFAH